MDPITLSHLSSKPFHHPVPLSPLIKNPSNSCYLPVTGCLHVPHEPFDMSHSHLLIPLHRISLPATSLLSSSQFILPTHPSPLPTLALKSPTILGSHRNLFLHVSYTPFHAAPISSSAWLVNCSSQPTHLNGHHPHSISLLLSPSTHFSNASPLSIIFSHESTPPSPRLPPTNHPSTSAFSYFSTTISHLSCLTFSAFYCFFPSHSASSCSPSPPTAVPSVPENLPHPQLSRISSPSLLILFLFLLLPSPYF